MVARSPDARPPRRSPNVALSNWRPDAELRLKCVELRSPDVELHLGCAKPRRLDSLERCLISLYSSKEHAESVVRSLENCVEDLIESNSMKSEAQSSVEVKSAIELF